MALSARYDLKSDRMRLTLQPAEGIARCFWLTRRQWLGWLHTLLALPLPPRAGSSSAPAQRSPLPKSRQRLAVDSDLEPQALKAIRLRSVGEKLQIGFVAEEGQSVTLTLPPDGVQQIRELLEQQAERAGWDVVAAMARLNAAAMANAALGKARKLH